MRSHLRTVLVVGLAVALLAWFLRNANLASVGHEIAHGRVDLLVLAFVATLATYALRSLRWQYLLKGLGPTKFANAFRATVIGFAASFLLPARAGEFLRPYLLARRENLKATSAFATVILERVLDAVTVLMFFAVFLLTRGPAAGGADPRVWRAVQAGGLGVAVVTAGILVVFFLLAGHPEKLGRASLRIEKVLPAALADKVSGLAQTFAEGLSVIRRPQQLLMVAFWSVPLWMSIGAGIWLVTRAFHIDCDYVGSFLTMTILVVGVAVPTPGSVGGFHEAYRIAVTSFFHAPNDAAVGAAIVLHAISFVPVTIAGIVFMAREGLTLGRMRRMAEGAGAGEAAR
jgi:glycosyltransferase 2 family protein